MMARPGERVTRWLRRLGVALAIAAFLGFMIYVAREDPVHTNRGNAGHSQSDVRNKRNVSVAAQRLEKAERLESRKGPDRPDIP